MPCAFWQKADSDGTRGCAAAPLFCGIGAGLLGRPSEDACESRRDMCEAAYEAAYEGARRALGPMLSQSSSSVMQSSSSGLAGARWGRVAPSSDILSASSDTSSRGDEDEDGRER